MKESIQLTRRCVKRKESRSRSGVFRDSRGLGAARPGYRNSVRYQESNRVSGDYGSLPMIW
ncbi:hypothetical protein K402DRAFT_390076 [Aulographum hederae CBS 113979]|uniref:Uncharacterized protein n=1 Tax=Aulographum hederae CBS 113979 TaxID=1176131 RepID=A0A6G1HBR8_9PEZI|nr:hypothetical protein K402DRAFT_390076 [Aulographum hederae CBS 113979]